MTDTRLAKTLTKIVGRLEDFGYPVFGLDLNKDEIRDNKSFFVYDENGRITPGQSRIQYLIEFTLMFITLEDKVMDEIEIAENVIQGTGLIFDGSVREQAKFQETDQIANTITWTFHRVVMVGR